MFGTGTGRRFSGVGTLNNATAVRLYTLTSTSKTAFITKITLSIVTHAAKFVALQDDNGSPKVIAKHNDLTAAAGVPSVVTWDLGRSGIPLTAGKNVECVSEATGVAGYVYVEGYEL
jgi:hypothetical protein